MSDSEYRPRRSMFVVFTYVWQVIMALLVVGCVVLAFIAEALRYPIWWVFLIEGVTFVIGFISAVYWRSSERSRNAMRGVR